MQIGFYGARCEDSLTDVGSWWTKTIDTLFVGIRKHIHLINTLISGEAA